MSNMTIFKEIDNFTDFLRQASFPRNSICFNLVNRGNKFGFIITIHLSSRSSCGNDNKVFSNSFSKVQECFVKTLDYFRKNENDFKVTHDGRDNGDTMIALTSYENPEFEYRVLTELADNYRQREFSLSVEYSFSSMTSYEFQRLKDFFDKFSLYDYKKQTKSFSEFQSSCDWMK